LKSKTISAQYTSIDIDKRFDTLYLDR